MHSADLLSESVKDYVIHTPGLSKTHKVIKVIDEVYRYVKIVNKKELLKKFCTILKKQDDRELTRVADDMLNESELGQYSCGLVNSLY